MKRKSYINHLMLLFSVFVVCAFSSLFLFSSNSYALDLSQDVSFVGSRQQVWFRTGSRNCRSGGNSCGWASEDWAASIYTMYTNANTTTRLYDLYIQLPVDNVQAGDYIVQTLYIWQDGLSVSGHSFVQSIAYGGTHNASVVDVQFESFSTNSGMITIITRANSAIYDADLKFVGNPSGTGVIDLAGGYTSNGTTGPAYMRPGTASLWRPRSQVDNSAAINSINNQLPTITNNLQNMNNSLDDINTGISDLKRSQEQANDDANDRYEDEKQTIQDNADEAENSANSFSPSFSITNPVESFFNAFKDEQCVDIPNLAQWIHWEGDPKLGGAKRVCTPWPSEVRSVVTPISIAMFGLVLTGFVIRWFKGSFVTETN